MSLRGRSAVPPDRRLRRRASAEADAGTDYRKMYDRTSALAKIGVWECDLATEALTWTDAVYDMFDLPRGSDLARARILERYEPGSRRAVEAARARAIAEGTRFRVDACLRTADASPRWIRITGDVEQEDGHPARIFGTKQDITEEKLAQLEVERLQRELIHLGRLGAMNAMASTLAHELNQPLAAIGIYAAAMRKMIDPESNLALSGTACLDGIERCASRAGDLIRSVRNMTNRGEMKRVPFELRKVIGEAADLALLAAPAETVLTCDCEHALRMFGDPIQIQQVMMNLITNAWEAAAPTGRVEIEIGAAERNGYVEVRVRDSGPGIPAAMVATLFESFSTSKSSNSGIGLSICRTIVEAHGGSIWVEDSQDRGGAIAFRVPAGGTTPSS